jgi:hypothetical protein
MAEDEPKKLGIPNSWEAMFPGRFLKAGLIVDDDGKRVRRTFTIKAISMRDVDGDGIGRPVIEFEETPQWLGLNKTNFLCLRAMFGGSSPQAAVGKRITVYPDKVKEAGKMQGDPCIRIWGSPDIAHDVDVSIALHKRKPYTMTMHKVVAGGGKESHG